MQQNNRECFIMKSQKWLILHHSQKAVYSDYSVAIHKISRVGCVNCVFPVVWGAE